MSRNIVVLAQTLAHGHARLRFKKIVARQHGRVHIVKNPSRLGRGRRCLRDGSANRSERRRIVKLGPAVLTSYA